jgi:methionyl-tRNA synthetase
MLKAHGEFSLPSTIIAGEYLTLEGKKMSKSRGWSVEIKEYLELFEPDPLRYHLVAVSPLNKDADFSWDEYLRRNNNELADILGNFIHRTLMFTYQFFDKQVPPMRKCDETDRGMLTTIAKTKEDVETALERFEFHQALRSIMGVAAHGNKYLNDKQPWKTLKLNRIEAMTTINIALQAVQALALLLEPFLPFTAEKMWKSLKLPGDIHNQRWSDIGQQLPVGHGIEKPQPLFRKIDAEETLRIT